MIGDKWVDFKGFYWWPIVWCIITPALLTVSKQFNSCGIKFFVTYCSKLRACRIDPVYCVKPVNKRDCLKQCV